MIGYIIIILIGVGVCFLNVARFPQVPISSMQAAYILAL